MSTETLLTEESNDAPVTDVPNEEVQNEATDTPTEEVESEVAEETPTEEVVYDDFNLPEGVTINDEVLSSATELFKDAGLTKEQAQKFIDLQVSMNEKSEQAAQSIRDEWVTNAKSDKEYGGDKFNESLGVAMQAVEKFGTPELKKMLNDTGVGNHPEMIRLLKRVGDLTMEDTPTNVGKVPTKEKSTLEILYPN